MRAALWSLAVWCVHSLAVPGVFAQDSRIGLDLTVVSSTRVAVLAGLNDRLAVRPSLAFRLEDLDREVGPGGQRDRLAMTELGLGLDALIRLGAEGRVAPYTGLGGSLLPRWYEGQSALSWSVRGLGGVRAAVAERIAVYGEVMLRYLDLSYRPLVPSAGRDRILFLETAPLGVIVYLR
ncbi:MAG: hypothetical protein KatS3mg081_1745 [Gemmatimonadales bacterium]|nr:MAG: hypothetical protein KatS3mg081_1745 [Gemmatimonadales bacterium]